MSVYRASWILPISRPPMADGWVRTSGGQIEALGAGQDSPMAPGEPRTCVDLGDCAILPALVNAHTHLELSWLRGRVAPASNLIDWIVAQMRERVKHAAGPEVVRAAARDAITQMKASGTGAVVDISNTLGVVDVLRGSGLAGMVCHEVIGFNVPDAGRAVADALGRLAQVDPGPWIGTALAPHAPYSVAPEIFAAISSHRAGEHLVPTSVHLGESPEEIELLMTGGGRWREVLERVGSWNPRFVAPGCGPVEYLDALGFWTGSTLAVHGVQLTPSALRLLADRGATLVTCPRSNQYVGVGEPPVEQFYASGVRVAVGTDSLASVDDLNLFQELAELHRLAPRVAPRSLLESATRIGAEALGLRTHLGVIEPAARAKLIAVEVPPDVRDVEEYLVGGISAGQVRWLEE
jgi:cytosine/adenosine deaminase-related metal-dependent hydrolase